MQGKQGGDDLFDRLSVSTVFKLSTVLTHLTLRIVSPYSFLPGNHLYSRITHRLRMIREFKK